MLQIIKWKIKLLIQLTKIQLKKVFWPGKYPYFTCDDIYPINLIRERDKRKLV